MTLHDAKDIIMGRESGKSDLKIIINVKWVNDFESKEKLIK